MKRVVSWLMVLSALSISLAGCLDPIAMLSDSDPVSTPVTPVARVTAVPGPTRSTEDNPLDLSGLLRTPVTQADRANQQAVESAEIPVADLRDLAIRFKGVPADSPLKNCTSTPTYRIGDVEQFSVLNSDTHENIIISATLIAETEQAYMWLDNQWLNQVDLNVFKQALQTFSTKIMPRNHTLFGKEEAPGIDCDPRVYILNTSNVMGARVGGFVSSVDRVTQQVRSDSNEKDMLRQP